MILLFSSLLSILFWQKDVPLKFSDFKSEKCDTTLINASAYVDCEIKVDYNISHDNVLEFKVYAVLHPESSYFRKLVFFNDNGFFIQYTTAIEQADGVYRKLDTARVVLEDSFKSVKVLRHEQTHFDLSEVYARKIRKAFSELKFISDTNYLQKYVEYYKYECTKNNNKFDSESFDNYKLELAWEAHVAQMLDSLKEYENPEGRVKLE